MDRRSVIASGAALLGAGLAGCTGGESTTETAGDGSGGDPASTTETPTSRETATPTEPASTATEGGAYSVEMAPVGTVTFESVPETWVANNGSWADMGVALGREVPKGVWLTSRYHTNYYDEIPGLEVDASDMVSLSQDGVSRERLISLDGDVNVIDPNFLQNRFKGWEQSDVETVAERTGPFFGNSVFSRGYPWHDYRYYSLYEAFGKLAAVFDRVDRYEAFVDLHDRFQSEVRSVVPAKAKRPDAAVLWSGDEPEKFYPYTIGNGTSFKHLRDLKVGDALGKSDVKDFHETRGQIDYETLLSVDPDVILLRGHESQPADEFRTKVVDYMRTHPTASNLTAVENGAVYRNVPLYQGPVSNLVVTERLAGDLYGVDRELFDRGRVADIVAGEV